MWPTVFPILRAPLSRSSPALHPSGTRPAAWQPRQISFGTEFSWAGTCAGLSNTQSRSSFMLANIDCLWQSWHSTRRCRVR